MDRYQTYHIKKVHEWGCIAQQHGEKYNGEYLQCQLCGKFKTPNGTIWNKKQFNLFLKENEVYHCDSTERLLKW